jgi:hydrogenase-4 transcriptional activator
MISNGSEDMDNLRELLLAVWAEACRHLEIRESARNFAGLLVKHLPLASLALVRFDAPRRAIIPAALADGDDDLPPEIICTTAQWRKLIAWAGGKTLLHGQGSRVPEELRLLARDHCPSDTLAAALTEEGRPAGAVLFIAKANTKFTSEEVRLVRKLVEPFAAALENDRRLQELSALREAAEADRRSLLNRLGRREMSDSIVGADSGLRHVMERVQLVAKSDVPVLILGDTGTGKEVTARAIHNGSQRGEGPFIRVNCGAIPAELIDSHLFGHEKGSFTGASDQRQGWFERASSGTLFLDEIGELPLPAQVRLLRVLQDHQIERVGGQQPLHVDVRIVAATHRDLATMVQEGTFREDLWYRINVFPILLPPLRERVDDIPALARHFAQRAATRFGLPLAEPQPEDLRLLCEYPWPGNIRELGAVIDRAAILGDGKRLEIAAALGAGVPANPRLTNFDLPTPSPNLNGSFPTLDEAMRQHIVAALKKTHGRIEGARGAAAILAINPHTLRARMRKLGVEWNAFRE